MPNNQTDVFENKRKEYYGNCSICNRYNTSFSWCQACDPQEIIESWSSRNTDIDECIKEFQFKATEYQNVIEWIPFNKLNNIQNIGKMSSATWLDGIRIVSNKDGEFIKSRSQACKVTLKNLHDSQNSLDFLSEFKDHIQFEESGNNGFKVYGLTHNTITNKYMLVFDEFGSKRNSSNGICTNCNLYNTSPAWCQLCDPPKITQGWTSGNKDIDDCIIEFQLKATKYEEIIEWIPFNKLDNFQEIIDGFSATWLDGLRIILGEDRNYTRSRTSPCTVDIKTLSDSNNSIDILNFKSNIQCKYKVYGLTRNTTTNEFMIVFEEFNSKRKECHGNCSNCNRYNTSKAWCLTCDPLRTSQGWSSGNINIDNYIKGFQIKAVEYEQIIEWIPFDKLDNIHKIGNRFSATWSDGIRIILGENLNCKQSRLQSCRVSLKALPNSQDALDFLRELKAHVQIESLKIYGLTRDATTNEYMIVFDEFNHKRNSTFRICAYCNRFNTSPAWCQSCDPLRIANGWTSGDKDIDDCIKEFQLKATKYDEIIEWIPFDRLFNIQQIDDGFSATWLGGMRKILSEDRNYTQPRSQSCGVTLKALPNIQRSSLDFLIEFKNYVQLKGSEHKIFGLTRNTVNNEYLMVLEFHYKRLKVNGTCSYCVRYNTSPAWCQACDPQKMTEGWTSGNKTIDDCIKELQLKTTKYEKIIEWIPFDRLNNIQKTCNGFSAFWLDGKRKILGEREKSTQSRTLSCGVDLKAFSDSQNLTDLINEFKDLINKFEVYGLTRNTTTNEYMVVFEEFISKRNERNGKCSYCGRYNTSKAWCQTCDPYRTTQGWTTSGNKNIDDCIKEFQLKATKYEDTIEWIPFIKLSNIHKTDDGFSATWLNGKRIISGDYKKYKQSRTSSHVVEFKALTSSQNSLDVLTEFKNFMQLEGGDLKVYGLTRSIITNEYMIVFGEFDSKRSKNYEKCPYCSRYNTSPAWCQSCDPKKITHGWTSGEKIVDDCIKEFQLKETEYENAIEWIPFGRLYNIKKIDDRFSAIWLDGKRSISRVFGGSTRSRTLPCTVDLKNFPGSHNSLDFLREFKNYVELRGKGLKVYGLTRNVTTNEFMMVLDFRKDSLYGKCTKCNQYNTSEAWCMACDPPRASQRWISGNKYIDKYIKELQLTATAYDEVIEWIPFDRFDNISESFLATCLDGVRKISYEYLKSTQSYSQSCRVALKALPDSQNSLNVLNEFKSYIQKERVEKVYGITRNTSTNELMIVFDKFYRERENFYGECSNCNQFNTSPAWCQSCDTLKATQGWTSGIKDIDDCIKEFQLEAEYYHDVIEWIPFDRLENIQKISDGLSATWLDGIRMNPYNDDDDEDEYSQLRSEPCGVVLKTLTNSQSSLDFLQEFKDLINKFEVHGLTRNTTTNEYMIVCDIFHSERSDYNGKCSICNRYNTSEAWCQTCDPQKITKGWTSGDKAIDDCIREFQLKTTEYEEAIEWIPFERLSGFRKINYGLLATWLDGRREMSDIYIQLRTSPCKVDLKSLPDFQNLSDFLNEFKTYVRFEDYVPNIYGLTQNTTTNEYFMVVNTFDFMRRDSNGNCADCNRYNTCKAWCQMCDPQKMTKGWTSGNKVVDDFIKKIQLRTTEFEEVIEWIAFDRLDNIQKTSNGFSATWLDGKRIDPYVNEKCTQSRTPPCTVDLKIMPDSQNSLDFLNEVKTCIDLDYNPIKVYGLTRNSATNEYLMVFDFKRDKRYGRCAYCDRYNTSKAWCVSCNPLIATQGWTSGNKNVDDCIKELQLEAKEYDELIEWIPFEKLDGIQGIKEGECGSVFIATWLDGKRTVSYTDLKYTQHRTPSYVVALKKLPSIHQDFLQEFKNYAQLRHKGSKLEVYGMTQDKTNNEYLMVFQYVNRGSLCKFLSTNFNELNWKNKLEQLTDISGDLAQIHEAGYVHCNLHSDNILQHQFIGDNLKSYISGLGLIKKNEDSCVNECVYGVLPYIAPEVLIKRTYTSAADIYSFGIIMVELSTGIPPYYDAENDEWLAIEICNGLRPEFSKDTPECYINLASRCMDANPSNRPSAKEIYNELNSWNHIISKSWNSVIDDLSWNNHKSEIKKAFQSANTVIPELITKSQSNFQDKFLSKLLNFKNLPEPVNKQQ